MDDCSRRVLQISFEVDFHGVPVAAFARVTCGQINLGQASSSQLTFPSSWPLQTDPSNLAKQDKGWARQELGQVVWSVSSSLGRGRVHPSSSQHLTRLFLPDPSGQPRCLLTWPKVSGRKPERLGWGLFVPWGGELLLLKSQESCFESGRLWAPPGLGVPCIVCISQEPPTSLNDNVS